MNIDKINEFIASTKKRIPHILGCDGEVVYSSNKTFAKGQYYYLGLNPGGAGFISIDKHISNFSTRTINSFINEAWKNGNGSYKEGEAPLQKNVKYLFREILNYPTEDVFSSNLIFKTSRKGGDINFGLAGYCWPVHEVALQTIKPEIVITCGNDKEKSAYGFINHLFGFSQSEYKLPNSAYWIKTAEIKINNSHMIMIGLPHLSRVNIVNNEPFRNILTDIVSSI